MSLRIPAVLAFTVVGVVGAAAAGALGCGGGSPPPSDAVTCLVRCIPTGVGSNACTPPTCATGPNLDVCPMGCAPEPIA
jgi:hypothetical protein